MVAKVVKLMAVPAALGLASFRVYSMTEETTDKISLRHLSVYSTETPELRYVEEEAGRLQAGFGLIRAGLQPYVRAVKNTCTSVQTGAISLYQAGHDTYHFLRDPPPGFLPRVGIISVSGLAGVVLARRGSRFRRIGVPVVMATIGMAVCYPIQTVGVLKVTGKKVYAASSSVASAFKSTPKVKDIVSDTDKVPAKIPAMPEGEPVPEAALVTEVPGVFPATDAAVKETGPVSEDSLTKALVTDVSPAVDTAQVDVLPVLAQNNVIPSEVASGVEPAPREETTPPPADEITTHPPVKEKPRFAPDPSLLDHGQAHPEDADLYSTRG